MGRVYRVLIALVLLWCCCTADRVPPQVELDLDLPPRQRWIQIYKELFGNQDFVYGVKGFLESSLNKLSEVCDEECAIRLVKAYVTAFPDYYEELVGMSSVIHFMNVTAPQLVVIQFAYEMGIFNYTTVDELQLPLNGPGCTSVLTCDKNNHVLHGRNFDWGPPEYARYIAAYMFRVNYTRNGQLLFQTDQIPTYAGVVTGVRLNGFSLSVNARTVNQTPTLDQFLNCLEAVPLQPTASGCRYYLENFKTYDEVVENLTTTAYCAPRYTIIGSNDGRGARFQHNLSDSYDDHQALVFKEELQCTDESWFVAQCNSDLNVSRSEDIRRDAIMNELDTEGRDYATTYVGLFRAMTVPKVKNADTVHTSVMSPNNGAITTVAYDI